MSNKKWAVPLPPEELSARSPGHYRMDTETGVEKRCPRCRDWWPLDLEFWYSNAGKRDGFGACCKACYDEWRNAKRARSRHLLLVHELGRA